MAFTLVVRGVNSYLIAQGSNLVSHLPSLLEGRSQPTQGLPPSPCQRAGSSVDLDACVQEMLHEDLRIQPQNMIQSDTSHTLLALSSHTSYTFGLPNYKG